MDTAKRKSSCCNLRGVCFTPGPFVPPTETQTEVYKKPFQQFKTRRYPKKKQKEIRKDSKMQDTELLECENVHGKKMKTKPHIASFFKTLKTVIPKRQLPFQKILEGIEDKSLLGLAFMDIHTPEELKPEFDGSPLIVKNTLVSREDIGEYIERIAKEHGFLNKPKRALISPHFGVEILVNTDMAKYYLEKALKF